MGLPSVRNTDPGNGAAPGNRQGNTYSRSARSCNGGEIRRPLAAVPAGENLWPRRLAIARSTLAQWVGQTGVQLQQLVDALREAVLAQRVVHADETPVQMLSPGEKKTHRAYVWAYCTTPFSALTTVVYDFSPSRAREHARNVLGSWNGNIQG